MMDMFIVLIFDDSFMVFSYVETCEIVHLK